MPTGYGKSLIYQLTQLIAECMNLHLNPVVVIVSLLIAIIEKQDKEADKFGIHTKPFYPATIVCKYEQIQGQPVFFIYQRPRLHHGYVELHHIYYVLIDFYASYVPPLTEALLREGPCFIT